MPSVTIGRSATIRALQVPAGPLSNRNPAPEKRSLPRPSPPSASSVAMLPASISAERPGSASCSCQLASLPENSTIRASLPSIGIDCCHCHPSRVLSSRTGSIALVDRIAVASGAGRRICSNSDGGPASCFGTGVDAWAALRPPISRTASGSAATVGTIDVELFMEISDSPWTTGDRRPVAKRPIPSNRTDEQRVPNTAGAKNIQLRAPECQIGHGTPAAGQSSRNRLSTIVRPG